MKDVFSWSLSSITMWLYPEKASMNVNILWPAVESTSWSILGKGKLSLGQALLRSVKSTHLFQSVRVEDFLNEVCGEEFIHLFHDGVFSLKSENYSFLFNWTKIRVNV